MTKIIPVVQDADWVPADDTALDRLTINPCRCSDPIVYHHRKVMQRIRKARDSENRNCWNLAHLATFAVASYAAALTLWAVVLAALVG